MRDPLVSTAALMSSPPDGKWCFRPVGLIAASPKACGVQFAPIADSLKTVVDRGVAIVSIGGGGPIMHHEDPKADSFDAIKCRVKAALCDPMAHCVLLSIDTPGGMLAGCFDTVAEIIVAAAEAGKPVYTYIDSEACSAAYALSLCGTVIWIPTTGLTGSIGVIECLQDVSVQDAMQGISYRFVSSGDRKMDRNPHVPFADREVGITDQKSQALRAAEIFFELVAERRGLDIEVLRALDGAVFIGAEAISAGLADRLGTLDSVVAELAANAGQPAAYNRSEPMPMKLSEAIAALTSVAAESKDENEKADARRMLAGFYGDAKDGDAKDGEHTMPDGGKMKDKDMPAEEPKPEAPKAEAAPAKEPDGDEGKQALAAVRASVDAARTALLATREDFTPEIKATLATSPLAVVKAAVETWPRMSAAVSSKSAVAAISAKGTQPNMRAESGENVDLGEMTEHESRMLAALNPKLPETAFVDDEGFSRIYALTPARQDAMLAARNARKAV